MKRQPGALTLSGSRLGRWSRWGCGTHGGFGRGVVYAAMAAGLASPHDPTAAADEIRTQLGQA